MNKRKRRALIRLLLHSGILLLSLAALFLFPFTVRIVTGNEMYPAVRDGELIVIAKPARLFSGSVILYRTEDGEEKLGRIADREDELIYITRDQFSEEAPEEKIPVPENRICGKVVFAMQHRGF